jgi:hypothetical protein
MNHLFLFEGAGSNPAGVDQTDLCFFECIGYPYFNDLRNDWSNPVTGAYRRDKPHDDR